VGEFLAALGRFIIVLIYLFFAIIRFGFVILLFGLGLAFVPIDIVGALLGKGGPPSASEAMFKAALELLEDVTQGLGNLDR